MTRHPTRGRERPARRTALATERWIDSRPSVRISILTCPDGASNATLTPGPWRRPTLGRRDSDWRLAGGRGIRRDFGGISGGTSGVLSNLSWRAIEFDGTTAPKTGCRRRGLRVPEWRPRCGFGDCGGWI